MLPLVIGTRGVTVTSQFAPLPLTAVTVPLTAVKLPTARPVTASLKV